MSSYALMVNVSLSMLSRDGHDLPHLMQTLSYQYAAFFC